MDTLAVSLHSSLQKDSDSEIKNSNQENKVSISLSKIIFYYFFYQLTSFLLGIGLIFIFFSAWKSFSIKFPIQLEVSIPQGVAIQIHL